MTKPHSTPLIMKFKTSKQNYVYDTWTNEILEVDDAIFELLPDRNMSPVDMTGLTDLAQQKALEEILAAQQRGLFCQDLPEIESFPEKHLSGLVEHALSHGPEQMILSITERCNLRCRYCIYSGAYTFDRKHSSKSTPWHTLRSSIDWYFSHGEQPKFSVGFYGGEPLLELPMIKQLVAYAKAKKKREVQFNVTTNGTLLSEEACRFLIDTGFRVLISLDGPAFVHDRYRVFRNGKGSFNRVWTGISRLRAMDECYFKENVGFNIVLAPPIELEAINRFIDEHPEVFHNSPIMVSGVNTQPSDVFQRMKVDLPYKPRPEEIRQSSEFFHRLKKDLCAQDKPTGLSRYYYGRDWVGLHQRRMSVMDRVVPSHGQCIPGKRKCFVDRDGDFYMCERVHPAFKIGDCKSGIDKNRVMKFLLEYNGFFSTQCRQCWAIRLCHKCYNDVRLGEDWSQERGRAFCARQRARLRQLLTRYCEIRECKDDAFKWCEDIEVH